MPLNIICSSRTEFLVDDLVEALSVAGDPRVIRCVLLPSRPLVEKVHVAMARRQGVAMGVDFLLPGAFFDRIAQAMQLDPLDPAWLPEGLFWRLLPWVGALAAEPGSRLASAKTDEHALLLLTRQIADRLDQYMHYRPDMIRAWDSDQAWAELPEDVLMDEDWQRRLWRHLASDSVTTPHLVARFESMKVKLASLTSDPFGQSLEALSTGPLPGGMLEMLEVLGRKSVVNLRMLMPSREYLKHIKSVAKQRRGGEVISRDREGHPLLASMGQQAVNSFAELDDLLDRYGGDFTILDHENSPEAGAQSSLLRAMQDDIRAARQPDPLQRPLEEKDIRSVRVHRCHGARREVEVLRDELLRAFDELEGLSAQDVMILTPDLQAHAHLAGILLPAPGYGIPLAFAETLVSVEDPLVAALAALLGLASGRAPLSEGLDLLSMPAVRRVLGDESAAGLADRLQRSGITFGLDSAHRSELGAGLETAGTWRFGLDRLLQGLWLGEEEDAVRPDGLPCLPQAGDLSSGLGDALRALRWADSMVLTALRWRGEKTGPLVWADRLRDAANDLFEHADTARESLRAIEESLISAGTRLGVEFPLGPAAIADYLAAFGQDEARKVRAVGGRLALGGLKPLRALPCRVLAMLGLSDQAFPRRNDAPAWDLMAAKHCIGDRDPREEDRQLFLDALLSAKDRIIITAPVRHVVTDKQMPFSVCVDEMIRCALNTAAAEPSQREILGRLLVVDHPLQPFSMANFVEAGSYDVVNRGLAEALLIPRSVAPFAPSSAVILPQASLDVLTVPLLLKFFRDPAKAWLGALALRAPDELKEAGTDDEPMDLQDPLRRWQVTQRLMHQALQNRVESSDERLTDRLAADRLLPYGKLGKALTRSALDALRGPLEALKAQTQGLILRDALASLTEPLAGTVWVAENGTCLVYLSASAWDSPRVMLECYVQACLASASGQILPTLAAARKGTGSSAKTRLRTLTALAAPDAKSYLESLLVLVRRGLTRPLPFDLNISLKLLDLKNDSERMAWEDALAISRSRSLALVTRDADPFQDGHLEAWKEAARSVLGPPLRWFAEGQASGDD